MASFTDLIDQLPEVDDFITTPVFDKNLTDITALALRGDVIRNPLSGGLNSAVGNLNNAISQISDVEKKVSQAKKTFQTGFRGVDRFNPPGVLSPAGLGSTVIGRAQNAAKSNPQLASAMQTLKQGKSQMVAALGQANRLLDHSNIMTSNVATVGGLINDAISTPSKFTSEIAGALPDSFPKKIPSFVKGGGIPNFSGLSLPSIPNLDLPDIELPAMPNMANLPGVSIPGIPNPNDVLNGLAGSLAGVGPDLVGSISSYASKLPDLAGDVAGIVGSLNTAPLNLAGDLVGALPASIPSPANLAKLADFSSLTGGLGSMAGGISDLVGGEIGGVDGLACSQLSLGGACGGLPSIGAASGLASSLAGLAGTSTTAKLVDAVATGPLKSKLADIAQARIPAVPSPTELVNRTTGTISDVVNEALGTTGVPIPAIGGALASAASLQSLDDARALAGQFCSSPCPIDGAGLANGRDAITQAQTLASTAISEAQVAAKTIVNSMRSDFQQAALGPGGGIGTLTLEEEAELVIDALEGNVLSEEEKDELLKYYTTKRSLLGQFL